MIIHVSISLYDLAKTISGVRPKNKSFDFDNQRRSGYLNGKEVIDIKYRVGIGRVYGIR